MVNSMVMCDSEEYYTGVLYLGEINGPNEGILIACLTETISGIYGKNDPSP